MIYLWLATLNLGIAAAFLQKAHYEFLKEQREHLNTAVLAADLQDKLKSMDDLKAKMEMLLLKNGLGR